jgi:hypothetical protein
MNKPQKGVRDKMSKEKRFEEMVEKFGKAQDKAWHSISERENILDPKEKLQLAYQLLKEIEDDDSFHGIEQVNLGEVVLILEKIISI